MTIVTASDAEEAHRYVRDSNRDAVDEWLATERVRVPNLVPVTQLEVGVGPRSSLNAPTFCRVRMPAQSITWIAPGRETLHKALLTQTSEAEQRPPISPLRIWSYVWRGRELVFFVAPDFKSACDRALARATTWGFAPATRRLVSANVEPIDGIRIRLRPPSLGSAPRCYRAWVKGVKVGWPPIEPETSVPSAPIPPKSGGEPPAIYALPPFLRYVV
jgi:hypothetical protein